MQPGSIVGFGLVFILVAWALSVALTLLLWARRRWLRRHGPAAERRAVEFATALPLLLGLTVVIVLAVESRFGSDHCTVHHHHVHLCLVHGAAWAHETWAVATVTLVSAVAAVRLTRLAIAGARHHARVSRLRRASRLDGGVWWVDTAQPLCFVSGLRDPEIFVSTGVWSVLADDERAAMLAHERAHVRHRDVARRLALEILLIIGAPLAVLLRRAWDSATERLCDARASIETSSGDAIASAMVKVSRLGLRPELAAIGFTPPRGMLADRVHAVLSEEPTGEGAAHRLQYGVAGAMTAIVVMIVVLAEPIHHAFESLLG